MSCQHLFPTPDADAQCWRCGERADAADYPFDEVLTHTVRLLAGAVGAAPPGYPSCTEAPATGSRVDRVWTARQSVRGAAPIGPAGTSGPVNTGRLRAVFPPGGDGTLAGPPPNAA